MANNIEKREHPRIKARWPVTIITDQGTIEGESRNITVAGVFINCDKQLPKNEICRMVIRPPQRRSIEVKGKVMWSNLDGNVPNSTLSGVGLSFIKISEEDRQLFNDAVSVYLE